MQTSYKQKSYQEAAYSTNANHKLIKLVKYPHPVFLSFLFPGCNCIADFCALHAWNRRKATRHRLGPTTMSGIRRRHVFCSIFSFEGFLRSRAGRGGDSIDWYFSHGRMQFCRSFRIFEVDAVFLKNILFLISHGLSRRFTCRQPTFDL